VSFNTNTILEGNKATKKEKEKQSNKKIMSNIKNNEKPQTRAKAKTLFVFFRRNSFVLN